MQRSVPFLWGLVILLLVLNLLLLDALNLARLTAIETLGQIETMLDSMAREVIVYDVKVNQAVPIQADIPFNRTMQIPINTVIPIDRTLSVPFQTPAGEMTLSVPVKTDVPIDVVVPVTFNETIAVDTIVQLNTTLPVRIEVARTPIATYLKQAQLDIARLRSRLALNRVASTVEEPVAPSVSEIRNDADIEAAAKRSDESGAPPVQLGTAPPDASEQGLMSDSSEVPQNLTAETVRSADEADVQTELGLCAHPYWPLWAGTEWTFSNRRNSYIQRVTAVSNNQVFLNTGYEGQEIEARFVCLEEGLGGSYLGDMGRVAMLGDLTFGNPRGVFLPRPEVMEELGRSWTQEMDVAGSIYARREDRPVEAKISRGRAVAVYTPVRFETIDSPSGPQKGLRIEQRLDLDLGIVFDLDGQTVPGTEMVNLRNIYWFVKDMGLVRMQWLGGTVQQVAELDNTSINQQTTVPTLAEDQLVSVCVTLTDQSIKCAQMEGFSQPDLTVPPVSELESLVFVFPKSAIPDTGSGLGEASRGTVPGGAGADKARSDLRAYAEAVQSFGQRASEAAQDFWEAALDFRDGRQTFDEFQNAFSQFAPKIQGLIQEMSRLVPPPGAETVHQKLVDGMGKCDEAVELMDQWFDAPDSNTKEAAAFLVAACVEEITAAGEELAALTDGD